MVLRPDIEFARARRLAALQQAAAAITGKPTRLLPFDEIRSQLRFSGAAHRGLQEISLDSIVGSVGRYQDFTRSFLPTQLANSERWINLRRFIEEHELAPIEVYRVGEAHFVIDGNHRVSIARKLKARTIPAYVTEVKTRVPLAIHDSPESLICKARYAEFLEQTNLDQLRPGCNLLLSFCEQYDLLLSQIEVNRYYLWQEDESEPEYPSVVADWYDHTYLPIVQVIREHNLLELFPEQTEADLYMLLSEHRLELKKQLHEPVAFDQAAEDLSHTRPGLKARLKRLFKRRGRI